MQYTLLYYFKMCGCILMYEVSNHNFYTIKFKWGCSGVICVVIKDFNCKRQFIHNKRRILFWSQSLQPRTTCFVKNYHSIENKDLQSVPLSHNMWKRNLFPLLTGQVAWKSSCRKSYHQKMVVKLPET